ncbi:MAG: hypothetical protein IPI79_14210 [Moraxellaceae bacterium]|nr:hypothetical protein [Moraxellaceae bacterium]
MIRYSLLDGAMVLSELCHIFDELADIEADNDYDFSGIKEELGLIEPTSVAALDDDFDFEGDEPVVAKKRKKKHSKKAKKTARGEQANFEKTEDVERRGRRF